MVIKQIFITPIFLNDGQSVRQIDCRKWSHDGDEKMTVGKIENNEQEMGYMGSYQIREIWKYAGHFNMANSQKIWKRVADENKPLNKIAHIYINNYGYIAVFSEEEGKKLFNDKEGVIINDLADKEKSELNAFLKKRNIVPENRIDSGCEICLNVLAETNNYEWDIHRLVATNFLEKPVDAWGVHHIDNNSYNNSVTNLVWVKKEEHDKKLHPLTYK